MKILVFGAGVIGTTYAWQLWEAGNDVSLLVRKQRMVRYSNSGISITCTDLRRKEKEYKKTVFRPKIVDRLEIKDGYELIIVSTKNFQLNDAIPYIAKYAGNARILILGHLWNEFELLRKHFTQNPIFVAFPSMALGSQTIAGINCYLFGNGNTLICNPEGKSGNELNEITGVLKGAGLQPRLMQTLEPWIRGHFIWQAATLVPLIKAGSFRLFAENKKLIVQSVLAVKEGLRVARKNNLKVDGNLPFWLFRLPAFAIAYFLKRSYTPTIQAAMEARFRHGLDEIKTQLLVLTSLGRKTGEKMPYLESFEKYLPEGEKKYLQQ